MAENGETQALSDLIAGQPKHRKKRKKVLDLRPVAFIRFNTRPKNAKPKVVTLRALLDSGGSGALVTAEHAKKLKRILKRDTQWTAPAGEMVASHAVSAQFSIPEMHDNKVIEWPAHVTCP